MRFVSMACAALALAACSNEQGGGDGTAPATLVFKDRGARQCETDGMSAEQSAQQLAEAGIDVLDSTCGRRTGIAFTTVCGAGTGDILVHEIRDTNVTHAEELGFERIETLVNAEQGTGYELLDCGERDPIEPTGQ